MQLSLTSYFVLVAVAAIGTINASPSPIRIVTPRPGVDYRIRVVTPNPRIRYLRSIDEDQFTGDSIDEVDSLRPFEAPLASERRYVRSADEDILDAPSVVDEVRHEIAKRSPERVVINWKPPPANGPRYARSADAEEQVEESEE